MQYSNEFAFLEHSHLNVESRLPINSQKTEGNDLLIKKKKKKLADNLKSK